VHLNGSFEMCCFLGTLFGMDLEETSQRRVVFLYKRRKEKMVH